MGYFFGLLKFQIIFGVLEIPVIFWGLTVDAGSEPTYAEKIRVPPWRTTQRTVSRTTMAEDDIFVISFRIFVENKTRIVT